MYLWTGVIALAKSTAKHAGAAVMRSANPGDCQIQERCEMTVTRRSVVAAGLALGAAATGLGRAQAAPAQAPLDKLRARLKGRLILPTDQDFDAARRPFSFNPETDKRPYLIARCEDTDDVARVLDFARNASLDIAVRSGGHDVLGASACEGVLIDLSSMNSIEIDSGKRIAHAGPGVRSDAFNLAAGRFNLAPVLGCNPSVGIAGLTLGGGLGWFLGTHGAACDNLLSVDLVTADGDRLHADAQTNPNLFWGLRGGGGNFGIATAFRYRLHLIDQVVGGNIGFRTDVKSFLRFYRDFMASAPKELAVELNIFPIETPVVMASVCWSGSIELADRVLAPLQAYQTPLFSSLRTVAYAHLTDNPQNSRKPPSNLFWRGGSLEMLGDGAIDELASAARNGPPGWSIGLGHYMHGKIAAVDDHATPLIRRSGRLSYFIGAGWNDPNQATPEMQWVRMSMSAMRRWSSQQTYINYLSDDSDAAVRAAYGSNFRRLQLLKRRYDPSNIFHHNRNIAT
jgi:FAD/FMN-containing dehydrogenase